MKIVLFIPALIISLLSLPNNLAKTVGTPTGKQNSIRVVKNTDNRIPINHNIKSIALIGPLANPETNVPTEGDKVISVLDALKASVSPSTEILYFKGCNINDTKSPVYDEALAAALEAEVVILVMGEEAAKSITNPAIVNEPLPGKQEELIKIIMRTNKPAILVLMNKHAPVNSWAFANVPVIIEAMPPASQNGETIVNTLFGKKN